MRDNLFRDKDLKEMIEVVEDITKCGLSPSRAAFVRLRELEQDGKEVESRLGNASGGTLLEWYRRYKDPEKETVRQTEKPQEATIFQHEFFFTLRQEPDSDEDFFQEILRLHKLYVPVFTMLHQSGNMDTAEAYRTWLFTRRG